MFLISIFHVNGMPKYAQLDFRFKCDVAFQIVRMYWWSSCMEIRQDGREWRMSGCSSYSATCSSICRNFHLDTMGKRCLPVPSGSGVEKISTGETT